MLHDLSVVDIDTFFEVHKSSCTSGHILKSKKGAVATDLGQCFFSLNESSVLELPCVAAVLEAEILNTFKSR